MYTLTLRITDKRYIIGRSINQYVRIVHVTNSFRMVFFTLLRCTIYRKGTTVGCVYWQCIYRGRVITLFNNFPGIPRYADRALPAQCFTCTRMWSITRTVHTRGGTQPRGIPSVSLFVFCNYIPHTCNVVKVMPVTLQWVWLDLYLSFKYHYTT